MPGNNDTALDRLRKDEHTAWQNLQSIRVGYEAQKALGRHPSHYPVIRAYYTAKAAQKATKAYERASDKRA